MKAHDTPSGTRMMWNIRVNAICALAQGTGSTAASTTVPPNVAITSTTAFPVHTPDNTRIVDDKAARAPRRHDTGSAFSLRRPHGQLVVDLRPSHDQDA